MGHKRDFEVVEKQQIEGPKHIAIIMDGNGRWAKDRGMSRAEGHLEGAKALRALVADAARMGVEYLTVYAFSTENWGRPSHEVEGLMALLNHFLKEYGKELIDNNIRLNTIGDLEELPQDCQHTLSDLKERTFNGKQMVLTLALNYGSRNELVRAVKNLMNEGQNPEELNWDTIAQNLDSKGLRDPDLIIRTSGQSRLSNFLMLQGAYAELYFTDVLWPDFNKEELAKAIDFYNSQERRFGKTSEQLDLQNKNITH